MKRCIECGKLVDDWMWLEMRGKKILCRECEGKKEYSKCKECGKELKTIEDCSESTGFIGYCKECEKRIMKEEGKE